MRIATRGKRFGTDLNDLEAAAQMIQDRVVITFLSVEELEKTGLPLKNLYCRRETRSRKKRREDAALRSEADPKPLGQRGRDRAVAGKRNSAISDSKRVK